MKKSEVEDSAEVKDIKSTAKQDSSGGAILDPQGNYFNPDTNFNDGDTPTVVMIGGKPRAVRNGVILDDNRTEKKADDMSKEELDWAKDNREDLQTAEGAENVKDKEDKSIIQGVKAVTNPLPVENLIDMEE